MHEPIAAIALVIVLGVGAQWLAARLKLPAILLLLAAGLLAGPVTGLLDPQDLLGDLLFPVVSLGVGLLLFDGALSLHRSEVGSWRGALLGLLTVGVAITWVVAALAGYFLGDLPLGVAVLFGAILTVTGPTVIIPLLRQARLRVRVARVLRWEGIIIDAVGATLGIVVLEVLVLRQGAAPDALIWGLVRTAGVGIAVGLAGAALVVFLLGRHLVDDHLQNAVALIVVVGSFAVAGSIRDEAGLIATTTLGLALANQRRAPVRHVVEFHESIGVLVLGGIFVLLGAQVDAPDLRAVALPAVGVLAVLVLVARPLSVAASTVRSSLSRNERLFLAALAPRGIVAAAVSALFALRLEAEGIDGGPRMAALTFLVVAGTVVIYGLATEPLSKALHVRMPEPTGVVVVGGSSPAIHLATTLAAEGVTVLTIATDDAEVRAARHNKLLVYNGRLASSVLEETLTGLGVRLALVVGGSEELRGHTVHQLIGVLGRGNVYVLPSIDDLTDADDGEPADPVRRLAGELTAEDLANRWEDGQRFTVLDQDAARRANGSVIPLLAVYDGGLTTIVGESPQAVPHRVVALGPVTGETR